MTVILLGFITLALVIILLTSLLNTLTFPRLRRQNPHQRPFVSLLIPARNEATVIGQTVRYLLEQTYTNFEVIVLDDHSSDETGNIARAAAQNDPRFRFLSGLPLPSGWLGKSWACHQLAQAARGDILVFIDADVRWEASALSALLALQEKHHAAMVTVWPTQQTQSWGERLVVPLMSFAIIGYLPEIMVRRSPFTAFAAANGQCLLFRRAPYETIGGHTTVKGQITEDIALARRLKQKGLRLVMADGNHLITCRMYDSWVAVRNGFAKNILAGHGNYVGVLLLSTLFHWSLFILPWLALPVALTLEWGFKWVSWLLILIILGIAVRIVSAAVTRQRIFDALLMPVSVLLMTLIAAQAVRWHFTGGPRWKERLLSQRG